MICLGDFGNAPVSVVATHIKFGPNTDDPDVARRVIDMQKNLYVRIDPLTHGTHFSFNTYLNLNEGVGGVMYGPLVDSLEDKLAELYPEAMDSGTPLCVSDVLFEVDLGGAIYYIGGETPTLPGVPGVL